MPVGSPRACVCSSTHRDTILDKVRHLEIARGIDGLQAFYSAPIGTPPRKNSTCNIKVYGASVRGSYWVPFLRGWPGTYTSCEVWHYILRPTRIVRGVLRSFL